MPSFVSIRIKSQSRGDISFADLIKTHQDLARKNVTIGILEPDRKYPDSDATLGEVALWQEFGTHRKDGSVMIPARSFLRTPFDATAERVFEMMRSSLPLIADDKKTVAKALAEVGTFVVNTIQRTIRMRIAPALAPYTLQKRREQGISGTIPLSATNFLYNSIHYAVRINQAGDSLK